MRFIEQMLIRASQIDGYRYLPTYAVVTRIRCVVYLNANFPNFAGNQRIGEKNHISRADVTASAGHRHLLVSKLQLKFCGNLRHL